MNREIEFYGRRLDNGGWLYGDLMHDDQGGCYIYPLDAENLYVQNKVDPDTVGQFTGLCDKHGVKIFEGDIVRWNKDQKLYVVEFRSGMFYASVEPCNPHIYGGFPLWFLCEDEQHCEIVGNRYDNPELLATK